jgi:hypothetical protein
MNGTCEIQGEKKNAYRVFMRKSEAKGALVRPWHRWKKY